MNAKYLSMTKISSAILFLSAITLMAPLEVQAKNCHHVYGNQQINNYFGPVGRGYQSYIPPRNHIKHKHSYKNRRPARGYYNQHHYRPPYGKYYSHHNNFSLGIRSGNTRIMIGY
jgi:hypothetical protein